MSKNEQYIVDYVFYNGMKVWNAFLNDSRNDLDLESGVNWLLKGLYNAVVGIRSAVRTIFTSFEQVELIGIFIPELEHVRLSVDTAFETDAGSWLRYSYAST